jgi:predicted transcriptional regulator
MKNELEGRVSEWMVSPVSTLREEAFLTEAAQQFEALGVSGLPVLDASARLTGLLSWADLRRAGRVMSQSPDRERHLRLPDARVGDFMKTRVPVVRRNLTLGACARRMLKQNVHRLYVAEDGPLEGVVATREMLGAVARARIETPLGALAIRTVATIAVHESLALAMARLRGDSALTLVVTDANSAPVGVFSRADALTAREADPTESVKLWMDPNVLSLPAELAAYRGAQQVYDQRGRYIAAHEGRAVVGLISGLGFTELVSANALV